MEGVQRGCHVGHDARGHAKGTHFALTRLSDLAHSFSPSSLHQIAAEIAAPLSQAKKISMVCDGSGDLGAAKLTGEVLQIMQSVPMLVKNMAGVDITAQVGARGGIGSRVS